MLKHFAFAACLVLTSVSTASAQYVTGNGTITQSGDISTSNDAAIRAMMQKSADDWNRGDLDSFATAYKNSPDILFIGKTIRHGYADMLAGYKKGYPTRDAMGLLSFSDIAVQPLDANFGTLTGWFHLKFRPEAPDMAHGYFLLVLEKTKQGWKIIRDDTTDVPVQK